MDDFLTLTESGAPDFQTGKLVGLEATAVRTALEALTTQWTATRWLAQLRALRGVTVTLQGGDVHLGVVVLDQGFTIPEAASALWQQVKERPDRKGEVVAILQSEPAE